MFLISVLVCCVLRWLCIEFSVTELTRVRLSSYFVGSLGFPAYRIVSADIVTAFLTGVPLISFSGLVSSTVWNTSGESKHPCLVPDLEGKQPAFCNKSDASCRFL